jgi:hypothetical protein
MVQFGGGIVADSNSASEWEETVAKGERIVAVLDRSRRRGWETRAAERARPMETAPRGNSTAEGDVAQ